MVERTRKTYLCCRLGSLSSPKNPTNLFVGVCQIEVARYYKIIQIAEYYDVYIIRRTKCRVCGRIFEDCEQYVTEYIEVQCCR